jgi:hypothetical protein
MMENSSVSHSPLVTFEEGDESAGQQVPGRKSKQQPYDYEDLSKVLSLPCMRHSGCSWGLSTRLEQNNSWGYKHYGGGEGGAGLNAQ